jgi:two-component system, chemotaxis family, protein-glutamate methylesterase/glutaminase
VDDRTSHRIVVIGASSGGVEALTALCRELPADLPAAVFIVLHLPAGPSLLPAILDRAGKLPADQVDRPRPIESGRIYVAVPDRHMVIRPGEVDAVNGPRENRVRPAIDVLFRSAALAYGSRVIGAILTGFLDDGAAGLAAIKRAGGLAVVQDPSDARSPGMPEAALMATTVDHVVPLASIAGLLARLAREPAPPVVPIPADLVTEAAVDAEQERHGMRLSAEQHRSRAAELAGHARRLPERIDRLGR